MRRSRWLLGLMPVLAVCAYAPQHEAGAAGATDATFGVVGDLACDASNPQFNEGAGSTSDCQEQSVSSAILNDTTLTNGLITLGDVQYDCDDPGDYAVSYDPTYGRLDPDLVAAVAGNHEYKTGTDAFGDQCPSSNASAAGFFNRFPVVSHPETSGHFSFDVGSWHFIGLNANCGKQNVGGCTATSPQTNWLRSDLAATTQPCIAAFWHQPLYQGLATDYLKQYKPWWDALLAAHADVVFNGHVHNYQRYVPMDSAKHSLASGITEYVVGTGGETQVAMKSTGVKPAQWAKTFGYLRLSLSATGWHSEFVTSTGTVLDPYDGTCHA